MNKYTKISTAFVLIILFIALILPASKGFAQSGILTKRISISFQNTSIPNALKQLENEINRSFSYNSSQVDKNKRINKSYSHTPIRSILDELMDQRIVELKENAEKIIFRVKEVDNWRGTLQGKVLDSREQPLSHVTVTLKPGDKKVITDNDGHYFFDNLQSGDYNLTFQSIGFQTIQLRSSLKQHSVSLAAVVLPISGNQLDQVTVVGQKDVQRLKASGFQMNAIGLKAYANSSKDINQVLNTSAGIRIRESGGLGSDFNFSINGLSGRAVRFFMDGIPMENFGVGMQFNNIPVNLADRVEVFKGVVPINLGADALGGGVNMVTQKSKDGYLDASYSLGSFATHRAALNSQFVDRNTGILVNVNGFYNYSKNNYWMHSNPKYEATISVPDGNGGFEEKSVKRFNDRFESAMLQGKIALIDKTWADRFGIGLLYNTHYKEFQTGANQNIVYGGVHRKGNFIMPSLQYEKQNLFVDGLSVNIIGNLGIDKYKIVDTSSNTYWWDGTIASSGNSHGELSKGSPISIRQYDNHFYLVRANMDYALTSTLHVALNYNFSKSRQESSELLRTTPYDPANLKKQILGLSLRGEFFDHRLNSTLFTKYYAFNVGLGNRQILVTDHYEIQNMDKQYHNFGVGLANRYKVLPQTAVRLSYEHAYRLPEQEEVLGNGVTIVANYDLRPERSHNLNIGVDHQIQISDKSIVRVDVGSFYRKATDLIYAIPWGNNSSKYLNERKVNVYGFETELQFKQGAIFEVNANVSYQKSIQNQRYIYNTATESATYKNVIPNQPWLFGNVLISAGKDNLLGKDSRIQLDWTTQYVHWFYLTWEAWGSKNSLNQIPTQFIQNLGLSYSFKNGRYNIAAESPNLTNRLLYDSFRLQKPGTSFNVKFRYFINKNLNNTNN
ncbi:carboxypeptidase-like regulatory domain-containing protein [Sphingobacterium sp. Mn56C]|uniref:carboxypeptidase-like regulatory domain-containing protein n=1 Tax=Sphingobacterium sp. Mn56C TaxID=3395261 RepID=UPI003BED18DC